MPGRARQRLPVAEQRVELKANASSSLLKEKQAVLVSHYYVDADLQDLAEETGGCVSDSLEMARFGRDHPAKTLVVAGVRFMGETAKILSPEKRILMPDLDATCSLDLGCPADEFAALLRSAHPDRTVVVYANTSAAVKARADWMVTSSIGLDIVKHLHEQGKKILWAPDKHLGSYIQKQTGADMLLWQGSCLVHDEFKGVELELAEGGVPAREECWCILSRRPMWWRWPMSSARPRRSSTLRWNRTPIPSSSPPTTASCTRCSAAAPGKRFIEAPTAGNSATCKSCAHCPWMAMNGLQNLADRAGRIWTARRSALPTKSSSMRKSASRL